nr:uncharacterized mitochondrial protein AtMg00810-like [Tanacetum cinerariifolium]
RNKEPVIYSFFASQSNSPQLDNDDLKQIDVDDLEEMDLKWQMGGMLQLSDERALCKKCRSPKDTRRNVPVETQRRNVPVETSTSNALLSQYDALESIKARILVYQQNKNVFEEDIKLLKLNVKLKDNSLVDLRKKFEKAEQERDELKLKLDKFQTSSKNLSQQLASQTNDKTGLCNDNQVFTSSVFNCDEMFSSESDVIFHDGPTINETVLTAFNIEPSSTKPSQDLSQSNRPLAPIIEDWVSDLEAESKEAVVPAAVLTRSKIVPLSTARPVNTAVPQTKVHHQRPVPHGVHKPHSTLRRHINRKPSPPASNFHLKVTTAKAPKVAFGGNPKGGKITGKGKIRTDTECIVLSPDFKLPDENHVLLRVPRENNMYNVDLKNIFSFRDLTCLFTKATLDESNVWHRRLGHINFKTMNKVVKGSGPTWMFDIDTLTKSMNYQPVATGNQPNPSACIQEHFDADKAREGKVQQYVLFPLWSFGFKDPQNTDDDATFEVEKPKSEVYVSPSSIAKTKKHDDKTNREAKGKSHVEFLTGFRNLSQEFEYFSDNSINEVNAASTPVLVVGQISTNSTNTFSASGPSNTAICPTLEKSSYVDTSQYPDDPNMPTLEDITYSDDEEDVATQTRIMTKMVKDQGGLTQINNEDFHTCIFACFLSQEEPKRVHQALKDPSWIEAMQEELLQFKIQKALYGLHQVPKAWYETLANYLLENGFHRGQIDQTLFIKKQKCNILWVQVYVDDIIFGSTNKDLCKDFVKLMKDKFQMSSMGELTFFLRLHVKQKPDGIFISQDKYVAEILRKFGLDGKSASTLINTEKPLLKDPDGEDLDVHTYRSMIGSPMYLTSSRPDIMFAICACAHFQVTPKAAHLHALKRIFRYLKGKPHLGLWYPKDSTFNLVAYSDSDYAGARLDRKSTAGGCQFLGCRLIYWQCKKKVVVATSSPEAEYVIAASCYAQVLWIQNQLLNYGLVRNVDSSSKFYMYPRFLQLMIAAQVGDLTSHTTKYTSPALTQKVFANMRRVGKGFSRVNTPLCEGMLVLPQAADDADDVADDIIAADVVAHVVAEPTPPSPTHTNTPPPPSQELPSTSQVAPTPPLSPHQSTQLQPSSPSQQP